MLLRSLFVSLSFSLLSSFASNASGDVVKDIRVLLQGNKPQEALDLLGTLPSAELGGLRGQALETLGDVKGACAYYERDIENRKEGRAAIHLRRLKCAEMRKDVGQKQALWGEILDEVSDPLLLEKGFQELKTLNGKDALALLQKRKKWFRLKAPLRDGKRREALANFYAAALDVATDAKEDKLAKEISIRLYEDLGDTEAGRAFFLRKDNKKLRSHKDKTHAIVRARSLVQQHKNRLVLATLKRHSPKVKDTSGEACEIRYMQGKTSRKMRRYRASRRDLDFVAASCKNVFQKKARYLQARVASYQNDKVALKLFESFAKDFPEDKLTDDVLLWKAEYHGHRRQNKKAIETYQLILKSFPEGDMHGKASFDLAMYQARNDNVKSARKTLEALIGNTREGPILLHDQAQYWRARFAVFPSLKDLRFSPETKLVDEGLAALEALALARPASYYGHMARLMRLEANAIRGLEEPALTKKLDDKARLHVKSMPRKKLKLTKDTPLAIGRNLLNDGYDSEALLYLDAVAFAALDEDKAITLAYLYDLAGHPEKSHQVLRARGKSMIGGHPDDDLALWMLAYPKAHKKAIDDAVNAVKLPAHIIFALAREESAFDAGVLSWAGAIGLTQLMPPTAREEAKLLRLKEPTLKALQEPELNARLGARHLSRRQNLGHPLLGIAAYNAGPGNVNRWKKSKRASLTIDAMIESITIEQTRRYVKKVTGSWVAYALLYGDVHEADFDVLLSKARIREKLLKQSRDKHGKSNVRDQPN
ncbi:MAG: transglycosylase SLT domain-containing protein [Deltaproteobacteria bacterium]|nr:transglycosylase SLT domain-containing protein [Deltaproteobacteria bacterium]